MMFNKEPETYFHILIVVMHNPITFLWTIQSCSYTFTILIDKHQIIYSTHFEYIHVHVV